MNIRIPVELTEEEALRLAGRAYTMGFKRVDPRKRWTKAELREAVVYLVNAMLREELANTEPNRPF